MMLTQNDLNMLKKVYMMRTLTVKQIYNLYYKDEMSLEEFITTRLNELEKAKYIKMVSFAGNYAVLVDDEGYNVLKDTVLVREVIDSESNKNKKGYNTQRENNMQVKAINHQIHLNEFVLQYEENLKKLPLDIKSEYFDEKNASKYVYMRPDGLVTTVYGNNKIDFFLEMDMATESAKQLEDKWVNYKNFIRSKQFYATDEKIVVLFILANTEKLEERRKLVIKTILNKFTEFNPRFEIYVGTKDYLLNLMFDLIINKPNYKFYTRELLNSKGIKSVSLANTDIMRNKIFNYIDGEKCVFLYDDATKNPVSVLDKIKNLSLYIQTMSEKLNKKCFYLIFVQDDKDSIDRFYSDIKSLELSYFLDNLVFITKERLETLPFNEACFVIFKDGSINHFRDQEFVEIVYERKIGLYED